MCYNNNNTNDEDSGPSDDDEKLTSKISCHHNHTMNMRMECVFFLFAPCLWKIMEKMCNQDAFCVSVSFCWTRWAIFHRLIFMKFKSVIALNATLCCHYYCSRIWMRPAKKIECAWKNIGKLLIFALCRDKKKRMARHVEGGRGGIMRKKLAVNTFNENALFL